MYVPTFIRAHVYKHHEHRVCRNDAVTIISGSKGLSISYSKSLNTIFTLKLCRGGVARIHWNIYNECILIAKH